MPDYLAVPQAQRDRLLHEKARYRQRGEIRWLRSYLSDALDDSELARQSDTVRLVAILFPAVAARAGWVVEDNRRWLAGQMSMRVSDASRAINRLVELGRIERVAGGEAFPSGDLQLPLERAISEPYPEPLSSHTPSDHRAIPLAKSEPSQAVLAQRSEAEADSASQRLARARGAEQSREEKDLQATQSVVSNAASALPDDSMRGGEIVNRIVAFACRGDTASAGFVRTEAALYPEYVQARALESLLGRRPKPSNPAGYIVNAMRSIAAENGVVRERPRIEREPEL